MTYKEFVTETVEGLSELYSLNESKALAMRVLMHFLHISEYEYHVDSGVFIPKPELEKLRGAVTELISGRPVQYVLGFEMFAGHRFDVSESVLIPRPETEQLFRMIRDEWHSAGYSELRILDLCTGSGCIAYSLAAEFPRASVFGCDISDEALAVASGQKVFLDEQCRKPLPISPSFFRCDVLDGPPDASDLGEMDIMVSNPPYVCESERDYMEKNVLDFEPSSALFVPDDDPLRFYRALSEWMSVCLRTGGRGYLEINEAFGEEVKALFESSGFSDVEVHSDFRNKPRFVTLTTFR